jgi:hypothetical protein
MRRFEYKVIDTGKRVEEELNELGANGWQVVGVTTKKQLFIPPPLRRAATSAPRPFAGWQPRCVRFTGRRRGAARGTRTRRGSRPPRD